MTNEPVMTLNELIEALTEMAREHGGNTPTTVVNVTIDKSSWRQVIVTSTHADVWLDRNHGRVGLIRTQ